MTKRWWIGAAIAGLVILAFIALLIVAEVRGRAAEDRAAVDASTSSATKIHATPNRPNGAQWVVDSTVEPVVAGAGIVIADGDGAVVGVDGVGGGERWHYRDPDRKVEVLRGTPDGKTVLAGFGDHVVGFDAMSGSVLFSEDTQTSANSDSSDRPLGGWSGLNLDGQETLLTNSAVVVDGGGLGRPGQIGVIDIRSGESIDGFGLPEGCAGDGHPVYPRASGELVVLACWHDDAANRERDSWKVQSGVLTVSGLDPVSGAESWHHDEKFTTAQDGDDRTAPMPSGAVEVSADGRVGKVSWTVAGGGRFDRGGRTQFLDLSSGADLNAVGSKDLAGVGHFLTADASSRVENSADGAKPGFLDPVTGKRATCPIATDLTDCLGADGTGWASVVGDRWIGGCADHDGDYEFDYSLTGPVTVCSRDLDGRHDHDAIIELDDEADLSNESGSGRLEVRPAPGAVLAVLSEFSADGGFRVIGLR